MNNKTNPPYANRVSGGADAYAEKPSQYFRGARTDYVAELPYNTDGSILELGCAEGGTGALALAGGKCKRYFGIELHEPSAIVAREKLTDVLIGDVEKIQLPFQENEFDALIISEVLEHLVDPWTVVGRLRKLLKPGGIVLASSPNVSHYSVVLNLLQGRWDLAERGVMDRTHLRWFTPRSYVNLFESNGFSITKVRPVAPISRKAKFINQLTGGRCLHLFMRQISVKGTRNHN